MKKLLPAAFAVLCLGLASADEPKPAATSGKIDWGKFVDSGKVVGEVEKASDTQLTLAVTRVTSVNRGKVSTKVEKTDYGVHENGLVRWLKMPTKLDLKGKKVQLTEKEQKELRAPAGAPGFAATKGDLVKGAKVELHLMRPKGVAADKLVSTDFKVKYAVIQDAATPIGGTPKSEEKDEKKEKKKP